MTNFREVLMKPHFMVVSPNRCQSPSENVLHLKLGNVDSEIRPDGL